MTHPLDSPTLRARETIRGVVRKLNSGLPVWTCEVELPNGATDTIWYRGYRVGDVVTLEWRPCEGGRFLADVNNPGGGAWL